MNDPVFIFKYKINLFILLNNLTSSISNTGFFIISRVIGQRKSRGIGNDCLPVIVFYYYYPE